AAAGAGVASGATGVTATGAGTANARGYTPPPSAQAQASGPGGRNGLQTPSFAGREQDFANEKFEANLRERTSPVSVEGARQALQSLPEETQRGVGHLVSEHGAGSREHLAYQAMGEWSPQEREALRTLAGGSAAVRAQAVNDVLADSDAPGSNGPAGEQTAAEAAVHGQPGGGAFDEGAADSPHDVPREASYADDQSGGAGAGFGGAPISQPPTKGGNGAAHAGAGGSPPGGGFGSLGSSLPGGSPATPATPTQRPGGEPPAPGPRPDNPAPPREPRGPDPDTLFPDG
ncbi:MAG: hypothetical protein ACRDPC_19625, partial [Solirubrobacteraceae bacterium]